jgi:hypothetical protein
VPSKICKPSFKMAYSNKKETEQGIK